MRKLKVALISEFYPNESHAGRLHKRLAEARKAGADLAVLPELPLNSWCPNTKNSNPEDAETLPGWRYFLQAEAAKRADIWLLGGLIYRHPMTGLRHNSAILWDNDGSACLEYDKMHLPEEAGFWETSHYEPGRYLPAVEYVQDMPVGVQICSDAFRPTGAQHLAAQGVGLILAPRATEAGNYSRWRMAYQYMAITTGAYVVSVNRPSQEPGVRIGGPSLVVDPAGEVLVESDDPLTVVTLKLNRIAKAKDSYPGYLAFPTSVYKEAWEEFDKDLL